MDAQSTPPLREVWYYAIASSQLKPGKMVSKIMLDEPVLLGRDKTGAAFALVDICPHRGIPLRFGKFDGCEIECCYHGWRFNPAGVCTAIPPLVEEQLPDLSKVRVKSYPVQEVQGGVWVFFGENPAGAPPIPVMPDLALDQKPKLVETMMFKGGIDHAVVGLVDPAHATFVHKSWFWRSTKSIRRKEKQFAPRPWGFTMVRHPPSSNSRAYRVLGGNRTTEIVFQLPGVRYEHIRTDRGVMAHLTTLTPVSGLETEINHSIYSTLPYMPAFLMRPFAYVFLRQDRDVIANQQLGLHYNPQLLLLGDPDVQAKWYFRLKNEFVRAQEEGRPFDNPITERVLKWRS